MEHGFDDIFPIVGEEEKTSRFALGFTGFENSLVVQTRSKRQLNLIVTDSIKLTQLLKLGVCEVRDLDLLVYDGLLAASLHGLIAQEFPAFAGCALEGT